MSEITKLYENAGVEKSFYNPYINENMYPSFTAEKQIELIKWLADYEKFCCWKFKPTNEWVIYDDNYIADGRDIANSDFAECLADFVNCLWQDLSEEEREVIRGILRT